MRVLGPDGRHIFGTNGTRNKFIQDQLHKAGVTESDWRYVYDPRIYPGVQIELTEHAVRVFEEHLALISLSAL